MKFLLRHLAKFTGKILNHFGVNDRRDSIAGKTTSIITGTSFETIIYSLILSLLRTSVSTSGPLSLLFLDVDSSNGRRMTFGVASFRGLPTVLDECAVGLIPSFSLSLPPAQVYIWVLEKCCNSQECGR